MTLEELKQFCDTIWVVDSEYKMEDGCHPIPHCVVFKDILSGRVERVWVADTSVETKCPISFGDRDLYVCYTATAEMSTHIALGWDKPKFLLDLFPEYLAQLSGVTDMSREEREKQKQEVGHKKEKKRIRSLLHACKVYGIETMSSEHKEQMRDVCIRGGPFTEEEKSSVLDYCEQDVDVTSKLFAAMLEDIHLPTAINLRSRYMSALAQVEWNGIPIDTVAREILINNWHKLEHGLIDRLDKDTKVYVDYKFSHNRFEELVRDKNYDWPVLETGKLSTTDKVFEEMVKIYPDLNNLKELKYSLGKMRLKGIVIGPDGRSRCSLQPFASVTARNQPSSTTYPFGPAKWIRCLIKPQRGNAVTYLDFSGQEFAIVANLSGDVNMIEAYSSGDPYMWWAIKVGLAPKGATKKTHPDVRDKLKTVALGVQYGLSSNGLGSRFMQSPAYGREMMGYHKRAFPTYWEWSQGIVDTAMVGGHLWTVFGWPNHAGACVEPNPRSLANFLAQGNGSEMLRVSVILCIEAGIKVIATVHDAILIECSEAECDEIVDKAKRFMIQASTEVLNGFPLRVDAKTYRDRFIDERGKEFWDVITTLPEVKSEFDKLLN